MKSVSKLATVFSSETLYEALKVGSDFVSSLRTELEVDVSEPKGFGTIRRTKLQFTNSIQNYSKTVLCTRKIWQRPNVLINRISILSLDCLDLDFTFSGSYVKSPRVKLSSEAIWLG